VKLTTHLHLVPRSKNDWSYTSTLPIRLHGVLLNPNTGTNLPFSLPLPVLRLRMHGATPPPPHTFIVWCLVKHRDNFTFTSYSVHVSCCVNSVHEIHMDLLIPVYSYCYICLFIYILFPSFPQPFSVRLSFYRCFCSFLVSPYTSGT
jgi:hypothetical protein